MTDEAEGEARVRETWRALRVLEESRTEALAEVARLRERAHHYEVQTTAMIGVIKSALTEYGGLRAPEDRAAAIEEAAKLRALAAKLREDALLYRRLAGEL